MHEPDHQDYLPPLPLAFLLSPDQSEGWLVGAVGIEPKTHHHGWNNRFKKLSAPSGAVSVLLNLEHLTVYKIITVL